jgi:hypothetical protein
MIRIIDQGTGWCVIVDGVVRGRFGCVFAACAEARRWGF